MVTTIQWTDQYGTRCVTVEGAQELAQLLQAILLVEEYKEPVTPVITEPTGEEENP